MIDLSNNNGAVDFEQVRQAGQYRVYLKRSEGADFADPRFTDYYNAARMVNCRVGCYHFARPSQFTPLQEATFFARLAPQLEPGQSLRHVIDLEDPLITPSPKVATWAHEFGSLVYEFTGSQYKIGLYGSPGYLEPCEFTKEQASVFEAVWIASYGRNDGKAYPFSVPAPWSLADVAAQQITDTARIPGCGGPVDLSRVFTDGLDVPALHTSVLSKLSKTKDHQLELDQSTWF